MRALGLVLMLACGESDDVELETTEQEQTEARDCRPVRVENCFDAWNDRACFYVPPECAQPVDADE